MLGVAAGVLLAAWLGPAARASGRAAGEGGLAASSAAAGPSAAVTFAAATFAAARPGRVRGLVLKAGST